MTIEIRAYGDRFLELFDPEQELKLITTDLTTGEGPVWHHRDQCFYFNNIGASCTWSYSEEKGLRLAFNNGTLCNGMCVTQDGRLLMCEQATSSVVVRNTDGTKRKVLADYYRDVELNSPNDIVQRSDGLIYFTDPVLGRGNKSTNVPRPYPSDMRPVYMLDPATRELIQVANGFQEPNGLCFSGDEKLLYVGDMAGVIRTYDVKSDGSLEAERIFAKLSGPVDGMKVDVRGNLLVASLREGLHWYSQEGELLGMIPLPIPVNFTWGESDFKTLLITTKACVYTLRTRVAGHDVKSLWAKKAE